MRSSTIHAFHWSYSSKEDVYVSIGTAAVDWLRCCAANRKIAGSIPDGVTGTFYWHKILCSHYGPGVDSASNRNEYQEHFLGVKTAGA